MEERAYGWYWVKWAFAWTMWSPAHWDDRGWHTETSERWVSESGNPLVIGPSIPEPPERRSAEAGDGE